GAQNHDHHQSVWFAHNKVNGLDFWANGKGTQIRQKMWYAYEDGDTEAIMSSVSGWFDPEGREVMEQEIVASLIPMQNNEHALEIQITMRSPDSGAVVELEQTNFGFFAVRVAKSLSAHFGGGTLTNSEGQVDEKNIFGKQARWMDYSGPVAVGQGSERRSVTEGITYFDHPTNPRYPTPWHVREDGWMGASFCLQEGITISKDLPLTLRYLLHAHSEAYDHAKAEAVQAEFAARPGFEVTKGTRKHRQFEVKRRAE
ncbi:MAG: PmoA family protein, partial [Planctomycetia bacterium]|nr:PmoA family protein [Planctomycetia bacterium]